MVSPDLPTGGSTRGLGNRFSGAGNADFGDYLCLREVTTHPLIATIISDGHVGAEMRARELSPSPKMEPDNRVGTLSTGGTSQLPSTPRNNLPSPRSSFVGREREMAEVSRLLGATRLLTLTGVGGSGKTRLALEAARDLVEEYPDGVWLVELAPLSEGELVAQAVAGALEVPERPGEPLVDTLMDFLRDRGLLLILDNCEHLVGAVARLAESLLDSCPRLRILAASREALDIPGEVRWPVPPLSRPDPRRRATVEELESSESARLFVERAWRRDPGFSLRERSAAVAGICERLEGIPLAIELAAARVGALSVGQISERLEGSLELLSHGGRTATQRQQTLKGTLDWSYDLLPEAERVLFKKLSVFAGGWTLEAAEAVGSGDSVECEDVLELLSGLVDKSLVVAEAARDGGMRYRLLEPIRQYAADRLQDGGETRAVRRRHALYFLGLAEVAEAGLEGAKQSAWLERLETEHDNIRAALSWSLERGGDAELGLRMGAALGEFWYSRSYLDEGRRWIEGALERAGRAPTAARAKALNGMSFLASYQGDLDRAKVISEEGLRLEGVEHFRTGSGDSVAAALKRTLGLVMSQLGEIEPAIGLFEESLTLSRGAGNSRGVAISLFRLGMALRLRSDKRAEESFVQALALCRELGDTALLATILTHRGMAFVYRGDFVRATASLEEAAATFREQNNRGYLAIDLIYLGWAALLRGDPESAEVLLREGLELERQVGDKICISEALGTFACLAEIRGDDGRAARLFGSAEAMREAMGYYQEPGDRALQEPYLIALRSRLDEASWEEALAEGRTMPLDDAFAYALSVEDHPAAQAPVTPPPGGLSPREVDVVRLVAEGLTNAQVAKKLYLSPRTVQRHLNSVYHKLGISSRAAATRFAAEHGLL